MSFVTICVVVELEYLRSKGRCEMLRLQEHGIGRKEAQELKGVLISIDNMEEAEAEALIAEVSAEIAEAASEGREEDAYNAYMENFAHLDTSKARPPTYHDEMMIEDRGWA